MSMVSAPHEEATRFFKLNGRAFTFREFRMGNLLPVAALHWVLLKIFRGGVASSTEVPPVSAMEPFEVGEQGWGPEAAAALGPQVESLAGLGFIDPIYHTMFHAPTATLYQFATLRHESGSTMARVFRRSWQYTRPAKEFVGVRMMSAVGEGGFVTTCSGQTDIHLPADCRVQYETGASNEALWATHRERLGGMRVVALGSRDDVRAQLARFHHEVVSFQTDRGVFSELDAEREARALELAQGDGPMTGELAQKEGVLWQLYEQQNRSGTWRSTLMLLFISLILFVVLGGTAWPWRFVLLLIPVLLFHELGHLAAMWVFRYRNLKMFFIPLLGAAVTGQHYTVAGWKKAVVYLMGPVPGIVAGVVVGIAALVMDHDLLLELSGLMLILNGFNLLPFPPLDGGWITRTLVTSRNWMLDIVFRSLAGFTLMVVGVAMGVRLIWILGLLMLLGLGLVYRVGKAVDEVRRKVTVPPADEASEELDRRVLDPLIESFETQAKRGLTSKTIAQQVLMAYESFYSRPPGVLASLGLGTVYVGSFGLALVFGMVLLMATQFDLGRFMDDAIHQPAFHCRCETSPGKTRLVLPEGAVTLVASYASEDEARGVFDSLPGEVPQGAVYDLMGQTVFLALPAGSSDQAREWSGRLWSAQGSVVVHQPGGTTLGRVLVFASMPDVADEIDQKLGGYLAGGPDMALIPPWSLEHQLTEPQQLARRTYRLLSEIQVDYADDQLVAINEQLTEAYRFGEDARAEALDEKYSERVELLRQEAQDAALAGQGEALDGRVVELYRQMPSYDALVGDSESEEDYEKYAEARRRWSVELSELMGRQPDATGEIKTHSPDSVHSGYLERNGTMLTLEMCSFNEPAVGLPAMLGWLCERGVRVQYEVHEDMVSYYGY